MLLEAIAEVGELVGGPEIAAPIGLLAASYDLGSDIASSRGVPLDEQISAKASDLAAEVSSNAAHAAAALDSIRAVVISDYGRLKALGELGEDASGVSVESISGALTAGADRYFATELMSIAYEVWSLNPSEAATRPTPDGCTEAGAGARFAGAADSTWVSFSRNPPNLTSQLKPPFQYTALILNKAGAFSGNSPPADVTDPMFAALSQNGYGIEKYAWFWEQQAKASSSDYINCD